MGSWQYLRKRCDYSWSLRRAPESLRLVDRMAPPTTHSMDYVSIRGDLGVIRMGPVVCLLGQFRGDREVVQK